MLNISSVPYESPLTILFQRLTVIFSDIFYIYGVMQWCKILSENRKLKTTFEGDEWFHPQLIISMLFLWNPGLLLVDHIHFQYNGFLNGIFLLSLAKMVQKSELWSAFWFAVLLNFKHIYLYVAPAYFVYLLKNYCFDDNLKFKLRNFLQLSAVVGSVFVYSLGPFILVGKFVELIQRLFPFKRGLTHAYWAPNFWAIYNTVDKSLGTVLSKNSETAAMTGGLVKEFKHQVLPNVTPTATMILVVVSMLVSNQISLQNVFNLLNLFL
ncbi:putative dolichyl pyrophosphate Glc1Man9GlcNAc2 alpha-1:3-glucosyltransferase-like protein [Dinothrombium tinctorium]|uniref:Alpha-1,3-glucosyltransferase n=1 Tax=Dinothrombium tinctorium TaxID=1965070 RepID=A0A3S3PF20_9ACAR|nr:putative dolichyl pyrophosphate Glc1Man9GlcNAc2 alpha-1:3-glucosyltransferase-like protein [Dinothrombium tinctorium]RWS16558.1 putative dolichyl pyrophosphate Glc1Man9GlcNAc2 alpha-1:3-glucosyltransferase-like protein [Dinothrombium tinctorium]